VQAYLLLMKISLFIH